MDIAIGKRRAVVQDKFFRAGARGLDFFVKPGGLPFVQAFGSRATRSAFMGKPVRGRFNVSLYSIAILEAQTVTADKNRVNERTEAELN